MGSETRTSTSHTERYGSPQEATTILSAMEAVGVISMKVLLEPTSEEVFSKPLPAPGCQGPRYGRGNNIMATLDGRRWFLQTQQGFGTGHIAVLRKVLNS